jgi:hypothetical protein
VNLRVRFTDFNIARYRLKWTRAGMAELADAHGLGPCALKACRFKSCSRHHSFIYMFSSSVELGDREMAC